MTFNKALLSALDKKGYFKGKEVYAVDLSEKRIAAVKKTNPCFKCFVADACKLKGIKNSSIDFLVSTQVIEHVESEERMTKEMRRVLRGNGIAFVSTVFKKKPAWYFYRCNGKWALDPTHLREYTEEKPLLDLFKKNGFAVIATNKERFWLSLAGFLFKSTGKRFEFLRFLKVPVPRYWQWEIVLKKIK